jgi:large subunit ribosomal protein L6
MSRIGKKPIEIPREVKLQIENQRIMVKGPKGQLFREIRPEIKVELKEGKIIVIPQIKTKKTKAFWGLTRQLIVNMIEGVTKGFEKKLKIEGIGYKASLKDEDLVLEVGFSHPVEIKAPQGIKFSVVKDIISIFGIDKELVGNVAAKIRKVRPPDPYKGKGIRYIDEIIRKKPGKKAVTGG